MKRVHLVPPGEQLVNDDGSKRVDPGVLRAAAVAIATFAVGGPAGRKVGDPVHEWVTEGRRKQYEDALKAGAEWAKRMTPYYSCGDLAHCLFTCLGCRDERYVNRTGDGGDVPWKPGMNVADVDASPAFVSAKRAGDRRPKPGDVLHVSPPDHVCVVQEVDEQAGTIKTANYGGPYGHESTLPYERRGAVTYVGARVLLGWVDVEGLVLRETALVPDAFDGGTEDEDPYDEEGLPVPPEDP